jgi:ribosome biogenesis GTPase A
MTKAKRMMQEDIKLIDLVIEVVDARIPLSSRNPDIDQLGQNKYRLIILNKADLVSDKIIADWTKYFESKGFFAVALDSRSRNGMKRVNAVIDKACQAKFERDRKRGILNRPVRAMVVGIPNVGKSTFINSFAGKACTKTGNKPGVTKGKQWIKLNKNVELLDTPGILWPKFEDQSVGLKLALIGSMNDEVLNIRDLSIELISFLQKDCQGMLSQRYGIDENTSAQECLIAVAQARHCIKKGNEPDFDKAAALIIDEFRSGTIGKIALEYPPETQNDIKE